MEVNFELIINNDNFPEILMSASTQFDIISIPVDINNLIKIIPPNLLLEYRNIAKNKILDMIQNNEIVFSGLYVNHIESINNYLKTLEGE